MKIKLEASNSIKPFIAEVKRSLLAELEVQKLKTIHRESLADLSKQRTVLRSLDPENITIKAFFDTIEPNVSGFFLMRIKQSLFTFLTMKNTDMQTTLMLAIRSRPDAVNALVEAAETLALSHMGYVFKSTTADGSNPLMLAIVHQPGCVDSLLGGINSLLPEDRDYVFSTRDSSGRTALELAIASGNRTVITSVKAAMGVSSEPLLTSSSSSSSSSSCSSSLFPVQDANPYIAELSLLNELNGRAGWRASGTKLYLQVESDEKNRVVQYLTKLPYVSLSIKPQAEGAIIHVKARCITSFLAEAAKRQDEFEQRPENESDDARLDPADECRQTL